MKLFGVLLGCLLFILSGCASLNARYEARDIDQEEIVQIPVDPDSNELPIDAEKKEDVLEAEDAVVEKEDESEADAEVVSNVEPQRAALENHKVSLKVYPDIPHHYNRHVQKWLDYFQGRGAPHMKRYLERSARYLPAMKKILKENGMPEDLVYIALIESGFGFSARSHAGAVGYWQFIAPTGRRYDLTINSLIDERKDPYKSTMAAVKYFRSLYNVFGNWYFAFAAYNGGENRMFRVLMKHESRDFWAIAETKRMLPKETVNYIPKYLAARMIAKNPERYGFKDLEYLEPLSYSEVVASQTVNLKTLAQEMGVDYEEIRMLNPQYNTEFAPNFNKSLVLRVPKGTSEKATLALSKSYVTNERMIAQARSNGTYTYRVRRGDNLSTIAKRHGTTVANLRALNKRLDRRGILRVGQRLIVPDRASPQQILKDLKKGTKEQRTADRKPKSSSRVIRSKQTVVVRKGDTLIGIANKYGVTLSQLLRENNLKSNSKLFVGKKLVIPTTAKKVIIVRKGDTLTNIARKHNVSLSRILSANDMNRKSKLLAGMELIIPD